MLPISLWLHEVQYAESRAPPLRGARGLRMSILVSVSVHLFDERGPCRPLPFTSPTVQHLLPHVLPTLLLPTKPERASTSRRSGRLHRSLSPDHPLPHDASSQNYPHRLHPRRVHTPFTCRMPGCSARASRQRQHERREVPTRHRRDSHLSIADCRC